MKNYNLLENALTTYTKGKEIPATLVKSYVDKKGARHEITFTKAEEVKALLATDNLAGIMKAGDIRLCVLFAKLDRLGIPARLKYKASWQFIADQYGFAKSTANTYINIGTTLFDENGVEKIDGIDCYTTGQLIPMVSFVSSYPYIADEIRVDNKFFELILKNVLCPSESCAVIASTLKLMKEGYIPKEWVKEIVDGGTVKWQVWFAPDVVFENCPFLKEVDNDNDNSKGGDGDNDNDNSKGGDDDGEGETVNPFDGLRACLTAIDGLQLSERLSTKWKLERNNFLALLDEIEESMN